MSDSLKACNDIVCDKNHGARKGKEELLNIRQGPSVAQKTLIFSISTPLSEAQKDWVRAKMCTGRF